MINLLILIILIVCLTSHIVDGDGGVSLFCQKWSKSHLRSAQMYTYLDVYIALVQFESLSQLNISCGHLIDHEITMLGLKSTHKNLLLDLNLDMRPVIHSFVFLDNLIGIEFHNLKGFNINPSTKYSSLEHNIDTVMFYDSYFDFYLNYTQLITPELCVRSNFENSIFDFGHDVTFMSVFYSKNVCPYVFMKSSCEYITFFRITNSFIYKNQLEFMPINETEDLAWRSILTLTLTVSYERITSRLINRNVFKNVITVYLLGYYYDIQDGLFEGFPRLKGIYILADNLGVLFAQGNKWMSHLNRNVTQNPGEIRPSGEKSLRASIYLLFFDKHTDDEIDLFKKVYSYPDEDFCLFKDFPHQHLVMPVIVSATKIACTCTIAWLIQYAEDFKKYDAKTYEYVYTLNNISETVCPQDIKCNFTERLAKCFQNQTQYQRKLGFFEETNFFFNLKLLQYIVDIFLQPFLCVTSMLTNVLIILVIRNKTPEIKKNLTNTMYSHIQVNAGFNITYAFIRLLSLINICVFPRTSFCSDIYKSPSSQYFKIYVVYFLGNTVRLCANTSYVCFSVSRYFWSTSNPSRFFYYFQKCNLNIFYSVVLALSSSFSLFKVFQFEVNSFFSSMSTDYPYDRYGVNFCFIKEDIEAKLFQPLKIKCQLFTSLNMINVICNNILFFFVSILIDASLIRFTNQNVERKKRLFAGGDNMRDLKQAIRIKEKVNKMIVTNGLLYFVSHVPEFALTLVVLALNTQLADSCMHDMSCVELFDIAQVFNLFSMSLQIFVFKHFDRNFRNSLNNVLDRKLLKCNAK